MTNTANLGKVAFSWKGAWSSATTYYEQDVVSKNGSTYVCVATTNSLNVDPTSAGNSDWEVFATGVDAVATGNNGIIYSDGTSLQTLPAGSANQVLKINSSGVPEWSTTTYRSGMRVKQLWDNTRALYRKNMVLMEDNLLKAWGYGGHYQLGLGSNTNNKSYPTRVAFPKGFAGVKEIPNKQGISPHPAGLIVEKDITVVDDGGQDKFAIDGTTAPTQTLTKGTTYKFDVSDSSVAGHPLSFKDGTGAAYTTGVTSSGTAGQAGAYVQIAIPLDAPDDLRYTCTTHGDVMGNTISTVEASGWYKKTWGVDYAYCSWCVDKAGNLWTWGANTFGVLGRGDNSRNDIPTNISDISGNSINGKTVDYVAFPSGTGYSYSGMWIVCTDGSLHYCGYNGHGQSGQGNTNNTYNTVEISTLFYDQVQVVAGSVNYPYVITLDEQGVLRFVGYSGYNTNGMNATNASIPTTITLGNNANGDPLKVAQIMCVAPRGVWIKDSLGDIYNWGHDSTSGWLGRGSTSPKTVGLVMSHSTANIIEIVHSGNDAGYSDASYMLADDGTVYASGYNGHGALGNGNTTSSNSYAAMNSLPTTAGQRIKYMVASGSNGYPFWMGLTEDGKVYACGYNGNGALALGDATNRSTPTEVPLSLTCTDIAPVGYSSEQGMSFLFEDGSMAQSGYGGDSQLPDDDSETSYVAQTVIF